ncbi:MAG TPA: DUF4249 family protein [Spirosoma sp.]|nr:DUF4249 family protein [Spirosoma sp.]
MKGFYSVFTPIQVSPPGDFYKSGTEPFEDCFSIPFDPTKGLGADSDFRFDYACRTKCWAILSSYTLDVFDDQFTNGGLIAKRKVGAIPFYQHSPCLVELRQGSLTKDAFRYYKLFQDQTQNTGGLADTPPTALIGNVHNVANPGEAVIGYFTASGISVIHHYVNRQDAVGLPYGSSDPTFVPQSAGEELFFALNRRAPFWSRLPPMIFACSLMVRNGHQRPSAHPARAKHPSGP